MALDVRTDAPAELPADRPALVLVYGQEAVAVHQPGVRPWRKSYLITKRATDITLSLLLLPVLLPVMTVCALLIWLEDPGPVMFSKERTGLGGTPFKMFKFRTMVTNAEELKRKYAHLNEHTWPDFKITNDPRVTRVGRFLRRTSFDELPQVFNVLKGEMSLVGPRPTSFPVSTYLLRHTERLEVRPGITGLWQVSGRGDVDFEDRIALDVEYIEKQSIWFDIKILLSTFSVVFRGRGAY
ncbi:MAG: sugar transferase [Pirellulaceae bacterium]